MAEARRRKQKEGLIFDGGVGGGACGCMPLCTDRTGEALYVSHVRDGRRDGEWKAQSGTLAVWHE